MKIKRKIILIVFGIFFLTGILIFSFVWGGVILLNNPSKENYPVRGVDVSSYQGNIDWETLAAQDIHFAFIKATEGSGYADEYFAYNYRQAQKTGLRIGAYHFFSYDSPGEAQAENFIKLVPKIENMLPPVIDVEFYGDKEENLPEKEKTIEQINIFNEKIYKHYGIMPIIYATEKSYELYIANEFQECDIWIRNVVTQPSLSDQREWTFWQYTNRATLEGYEGTEKFIDMNVFYTTEEDFKNYPK